MKSRQISTSVELPELNTRQKFLITEPDDKGFAQEQVEKIIQNLYLQQQLKLKPWQKDSYKNIYSSSGKSNHQLLKNLRGRVNSGKTPVNLSNISNNRYYKENEIKTINTSQEISKHVLSNSEIKLKYKPPLTDLKKYTEQTKQICKNNMLSDLIKIERNKMLKKQNDYNNALKYELESLNKDILKFEKYATSEFIQKSQRSKEYNTIKSNIKVLAEKIKHLSQEYHAIKVEMQRTIKNINDKKIYVNFFHKLFGGEPELKKINLEDLNFHSLNDNELHSITLKIDSEMKKYKSQENLLITATQEEFSEGGDSNKIDIVFNIMESNIMKTLATKEKIRNESVSMANNWEKEKEELIYMIKQNEKEYKILMDEYLREKKCVELISFNSNGYNNYMKKLHIELFESIKDATINNKSDINEYNIIDKIVKPNLDEIKTKENKIDKLLFEMEKYSVEDNNLFNNSVTKIKNENKILKYMSDKNNRDIENSLRNAKILEKVNKIIITGKNKYKMHAPLYLLKKQNNNKKELKTESSDLQLLQY